MATAECHATGPAWEHEVHNKRCTALHRTALHSAHSGSMSSCMAALPTGLCTAHVVTVTMTVACHLPPCPQAGVITDIVLLATVGIRVILVHGGGPEINSWLEKVGIKPEFKNGLRVTDGE